MRVPTIFAIIGLILAALGGFWYWQIMRVAFASVIGGPDVSRTEWYALGLVGLGLAIFLTCLVVNLLMRDRDA